MLPIVIQCRLNSSRLPGKAALDMCGKPLLVRVIERCRAASYASDVILATSQESQDDIPIAMADSCGAKSYRGPLNDVRKRFIGCASTFGAKTIIRVTADNPFVEPALIDALIAYKHANPDCAYAVHDLSQTVYGVAAELIDMDMLDSLETVLPEKGREHVTTGLVDLETAVVLSPPKEYRDQSLALTVDTLIQYQTAWRIMNKFGNGADAVPNIVAAYQSGSEPSIDFQMRP